MHRVLIPPEAIHGDHITVEDAAQIHHLVRVLRVRVGDQLECFDGRGHAYRGSITECTRRVVGVTVEEQRQEAPPAVQFLLAQALIRPERFEWVIQKATELGVAEVVPLITSRTTIQTSSDGEQRLARWRRIATEATTQCGRATIPKVACLQAFGAFLETVGDQLALLFSLADAGEPLEACAAALQRTRRVAVLIGPEGDFSAEEVALAKQHGARVVRLGGATLRAETAAIAALAILEHRVGML